MAEGCFTPSQSARSRCCYEGVTGGFTVLRTSNGPPAMILYQGQKRSGLIASLAGAFTALGLTAVVIAATGGVFQDDSQPPRLEQVTWLSIQRGADGVLEVRDAGTDEALDTVAAGEGGFARGVYDSLLKERERRGIEVGAPLQLGLTSDGNLMLFDPFTSTRIALRSFGDSKAAVFEALLDRVLERQWEPTDET
ncbi:MAG: photosynthetic complex assembly protein PuhC [Pseudomonadota bacterium]